MGPMGPGRRGGRRANGGGGGGNPTLGWNPTRGGLGLRTQLRVGSDPTPNWLRWSTRRGGAQPLRLARAEEAQIRGGLGSPREREAGREEEGGGWFPDPYPTPPQGLARLGYAPRCLLVLGLPRLPLLGATCRPWLGRPRPRRSAKAHVVGTGPVPDVGDNDLTVEHRNGVSRAANAAFRQPLLPFCGPSPSRSHAGSHSGFQTDARPQR